jgi:hypothetical protein
MATRSNIGILNSDGTVDYIYCHYDGYVEHNGKILNEHYKTESKVRALIALGDLSTLGHEIGEQHDFNGPRIMEWCLAYGRDRGISESNTKARKCSYVDYTKEHFEEYIYLFTPGKGWEVREDGANYWADLNKALETMEI